MGFDFFAIGTLGFYPTPTPTAAQRAAFAATWGYINIGAWALGSIPQRGLGRQGLTLNLT